jgi:Uma2 family endonuclease
MMALSHDPWMSIEEYLHLDRSSTEARFEYIDGYVTMLAGGTLDHATIGANIISILRRSLRGSPCRVFTSDARVRLSLTRFVYPDATVSCDKQDRGRKFGFYRECQTIQEYLLIDAQRPMLEVYRRERHDLWLLRAYRMDEEVELANLGVHFAVSEVYEDVIFPPENENPRP